MNLNLCLVLLLICSDTIETCKYITQNRQRYKAVRNYVIQNFYNFEKLWFEIKAEAQIKCVIVGLKNLSCKLFTHGDFKYYLLRIVRICIFIKKN